MTYKKSEYFFVNSQFELKKTINERDQSLMSLKEKELDLQRLSDQANASLNEKNSELKRLADQANEQIAKLNRDLERLREHLVEMSDNYNKEAIQAENREKELRLMLTKAEETTSNQNTNIINAK